MQSFLPQRQGCGRSDQNSDFQLLLTLHVAMMILPCSSVQLNRFSFVWFNEIRLFVQFSVMLTLSISVTNLSYTATWGQYPCVFLPSLSTKSDAWSVLLIHINQASDSFKFKARELAQFLDSKFINLLVSKKHIWPNAWRLQKGPVCDAILLQKW